MKEMKVATRLITGFLIVSLLGAVVAGIGIYNMSRVNDAAERLYREELMGISHIKEANVKLVYIHRAIRNALLASSDQERNKYLGDVEKSSNDMKEYLNRARLLTKTPEGQSTTRALQDTPGPNVPNVASKASTALATVPTRAAVVVKRPVTTAADGWEEF